MGRNSSAEMKVLHKVADKAPKRAWLRDLGHGAIDWVDPAMGKGRIVLEFGETTVEGKFKDRRFEEVSVEGAASPRVTLDCPELLGRLDGLTRGVMRELRRLDENGHRSGGFEQASHSWRIARLHLGIGRGREGGEKADEGIEHLKAALVGAPVRDLELRELGDDLIRRLDDIGQHSQAGCLREVLGDAAQ